MKRSSLVWSLGHQGTRQALSMCTFFAMASLLEPTDFGTIAMLLVWIGFGTLLVDAGFGAAVVQRGELTEKHLTSAFASNILLALVSFIAIWFLAPIISNAYGESAMADLLRALALVILLSGIVSTKVSLAQREMRFRQMAIRDSFAVVIGGIAGIACALSGWGVWSLVVQTLLIAALSAVVTWRIVPWRPHRRDFSLKAVRDMSGFSGRMLFYGFIKIAVQNLDVVLIGYTMGLAMAGLYSFSSKMIITPAGAVRAAFGAYFFPVFSRLQNCRETLATEYERALKLVGYGSLPFLLIFYFVVNQFVEYTFQDKWIGAAPVAKALTYVALFQMSISISGELIKASGRAGIMIWWAAGLSSSTAAAIGIGAHWGLVGIAAAIAIVHAICMIVCLSIGVWLTTRTMRTRLFAAALGPVFMFSCVVASWEFLSLAEFNGWFGAWVRLLVTFALFAAVIASFRRQILVWFELASSGR